MAFLVWCARILAAVGLLLALVLALSAAWSGALEGLFLGGLSWVVGDRLAARRRLPGAGRPKPPETGTSHPEGS